MTNPVPEVAATPRRPSPRPRKGSPQKSPAGACRAQTPRLDRGDTSETPASTPLAGVNRPAPEISAAALARFMGWAAAYGAALLTLATASLIARHYITGGPWLPDDLPAGGLLTLATIAAATLAALLARTSLLRTARDQEAPPC